MKIHVSAAAVSAIHNDPGSPAVSYADDFCLACIGRPYQSDHALDGRILTDLSSLHLKSAKLIDRTRGYFISNPLINGERFTGHNCLVNGGLAADDNSVNRDSFTGQNTDDVTDQHFLSRYNLLCIFGDDSCSLGSQMYQLFNTSPCLGNGHILQKSAKLHDERNFACGKILTDNHGRNQRKGNENVGLDVKCCNKTDNGLQHNRQTAKDDGDPSCIKGQRRQMEDADNQGNA